MSYITRLLAKKLKYLNQAAEWGQFWPGPTSCPLRWGTGLNLMLVCPTSGAALALPLILTIKHKFRFGKYDIIQLLGVHKVGNGTKRGPWLKKVAEH